MSERRDRGWKIEWAKRRACSKLASKLATKTKGPFYTKQFVITTTDFIPGRRTITHTTTQSRIHILTSLTDAWTSSWTSMIFSPKHRNLFVHWMSSSLARHPLVSFKEVIGFTFNFSQMTDQLESWSHICKGQKNGNVFEDVYCLTSYRVMLCLHFCAP